MAEGDPHPRQKLASRGIARQVGAQHQRVDEEADQPLQLAAGTVGDGRAEDDVVLAGVAVHEGLKGGEQGHEERDAVLPREARGRGLPLGGKLEPVRPAAEALDRRARPVSRQLHHR